MANTEHDVEPGRRDAAADLGSRRIRLDPYGQSMGPLPHLQAERERLRSLRYEYFDVVPTGTTLGGEVRGLDLTAPLAEPVVAELRKALVDFKVVFFREQALSTDQHLRFAQLFGELEIHPFFKANDEHPELARLEKSDTVAGFENAWHHDVTWRSEPSMGAVLRAVEVPDTGGDTLFADMSAAYDGLPSSLRERVDGLFAVHDFVTAFGHTVPADKRTEMREKYLPVRHPVVRTHPESGRKLIFVNRLFTSHIEGLPDAESIALVNELASQAETVEYQVRFRWEADSVVFWDNRSVQHYAASDYWPDRRIMERASIVGDRPC